MSSKIRRMMAAHGLGLENDEGRPADGEGRPAEGGEGAGAGAGEGGEGGAAGGEGGEGTGGEATPEPVIVEVEPLTSEDTEAGEHAEAVEAAQEVEEVADVVEELEEAHEGLEAMHIDLVAARKSGGLSAQSAHFAGKHIASLVGRFGMDSQPVALEHFGGASSRMHATIGMEADVVQKMRDVLNTAIEALKAMWRKVIEWFKKVLDSSPKIKARAEALAKAADSMTGEAKEKEVSGDAAALHIAGSLPSDLAGAVAKLEGASEELLVKFPAASLGMSTDAINSIKEVKVEEGKVGESVKAAVKKVVDGATKAAHSLGLKPLVGKDTRFGEGVDVYAGDELLGGKAMFAGIPARAESAKAITGIKLGVQNYKEGVSVKADQKFKTLTGEQVKKIAESAAKICDRVGANKGIYEQNLRAIDTLKSVGGSAAQKVDAADKVSAEEKNEVKALVMGVVGLTQRAGANATSSTGYLLNTVRAALDVCGASAKAYGVGAKAKEEKKEGQAAA